MRDEFLTNYQGKQYVLFAGLISEGHDRGLKSIDTELGQVPSEENGKVAIVKARVEMEDGRTFTGIGDASPENIGRGGGKRLIAQAETRAKARALRDALNVGATALEELSDGTEGAPVQEPPRQELGVLEGEASAVKGRVELLRRMVTDARGPDGVAKMEDYLNKRLEELTTREVNEWIDKLTEREVR